MTRANKVSVIPILFVLLLLAFTFCSSRGQGGMTQIFYVETDRSVYEIGQNVNVTAAWYIDYEGGPECSEAVISCLRGGGVVESREWFNEPQGYHVHHALFLLDPNDWNPAEAGENGTADCLLSLPMSEHGYEERGSTFKLKRATQDCSLIEVAPAQPTANVSSISLFFRVHNANNSSFGVGLDSVYYNVTNPFGRTLLANNRTSTDTDGNFVISFNPGFTHGDYLVSLRSSENSKYLEGRFAYNVTVGRSPIPTALEVNWRYTGSTFNSTETYALEPVEVSAQLAEVFDGSVIGFQQVTFALVDSLSLETVSQSIETTNASGLATCALVIPYKGEFTLEVSYSGFYGAWLPSLNASTHPIEARTRDISITELVSLPPVVNLGQEYLAEYLVVDTLSRSPVMNFNVSSSADGLILSNGTTNNYGVVDLGLCIPADRWYLAGNLTLSVETLSGSAKGIYGVKSLSRQLLCKIPTVTTLKVYPRDVVEDGETVLVSAQLLSFNFTPISAEHVTFTVFVNQKSSPLSTITELTDDQGMCSVLLKLSEPGSVMIVANFSGNYTFGYSNATCSTSVFPKFSGRLSSSISATSLTCLLSIISALFVGKGKRKAGWRHVILPPKDP